MQTHSKPSTAGSQALKIGAVIGAILLVGLFAAMKLERTTGDGLSATILVLLYLTGAAAMLAPRDAKSRHMCG